jgi:hypothetical protein
MIAEDGAIAHTHYFVQCLKIGKDEQSVVVKHQ